MTEASFSGSVPENYDKLLVPLIFEVYADDLTRRVNVPSDGRVLETACGTGVVTEKLRKHLPADVHLVATDISPDMQAVAIRKLGGAERITFELQDATALTYEDHAFDAAVCQFGVMFYPDKAVGFSHTARVLKPGGTFSFNVWDTLEHNPMAAVINSAAATLIPEDASVFMNTPFGYNNQDEIRATLKDSGFGEVECHVVKFESRTESARTAAESFVTATPMMPMFAEVGIDRVIDELESLIAAEFGDGPIAAPIQAIVFEATR